MGSLTDTDFSGETESDAITIEDGFTTSITILVTAP
jgi:hypothetical protein